jgi:Lon protease-like protein
MTATLHMHESSHRKALSCALRQQNGRFVIAWSGDSAEVCDGPTPLPRHGTCVEVVSVEENTDDTMTVVVRGQQRIMNRLAREEQFRDSQGQLRSLLYVRNEPAPLERRDLNEELLGAWDATETFLQYTSTFYGPDMRVRIDDSLPDDPPALAAFLCTNLSVGAATRQVLLDASSLTECFRMVRTLTASSLQARASAVLDSTPDFTPDSTADSTADSTVRPCAG